MTYFYSTQSPLTIIHISYNYWFKAQTEYKTQIELLIKMFETRTEFKKNNREKKEVVIYQEVVYEMNQIANGLDSK